MKKIFLSVSFIVFASLVIMSCKKDEVRAILDTSNAKINLAASTSSLVLDSTKKTQNATIFSWNVPNVGFQAPLTFTLQVDSINDNFAKPTNIVLAANATSFSYTVADLNAIALALGLKPTVSGKIHARIKVDINQAIGTPTLSSLYSNVVDLTITSYSIKPTPKYPVPDNLYLVGDATPSGWNNPVDTPNQKFTRIDDNTFGMIVQLTGGAHFLFLPKNGDWSHKYALLATSSSGGTFQPDAGNDIPGPATSGLYQIIVDFVQGSYTVTSLSSNPNPTNLYLVGDATAGGWNNPVPVPSQQFTRISNGEFQITIPLNGGASYLFLPLNGDWSHKFGGSSKTGGALLADNNVPGSNTPAPSSSGTYTINVNFFAKTYTVK